MPSSLPRAHALAAPPHVSRAVVIGASLAGLLAARVLSDHYQEVLLLERDELPDAPGPRKSTPHAGHAHGLLARGVQGFEALFPGLKTELMQQGVLSADVLAGVPFMAGPRRLAPGRLGVDGLAVSRPLLEATVRRRVLALPGVQLLDGVVATALLSNAERTQVTGVRLQRLSDLLNEAGSEDEALPAALVVDASGRGSRLPAWLHGLGYDAPEQEDVEVGVGYATAYFKREPRQLMSAQGELAGMLVSATPELPRSGVVLAQEPGADGVPRWVLTLAGYRGDHPVATLAGLRQRAREMGCAAMLQVAEHGELLSPVTSYGFPRSQWRHYEKLKRFPGGLLAMGDAIASFNPTYGQGMTVAVCEAQALQQALRSGAHQLAPRFFKAAARIVGVPWQIAVGADLALPRVPGERKLPVRIVNAYMARLFRAAEHDAAVAAAFVQVAHMLKAPPSLLAPRTLWRVLRGARPPQAERDDARTGTAIKA